MCVSVVAAVEYVVAVCDVVPTFARAARVILVSVVVVLSRLRLSAVVACKVVRSRPISAAVSVSALVSCAIGAFAVGGVFAVRAVVFPVVFAVICFARVWASAVFSVSVFAFWAAVLCCVFYSGRMRNRVSVGLSLKCTKTLRFCRNVRFVVVVNGAVEKVRRNRSA